MTDRISTTIILDKALHDKVKQLAAADHRSVNSLINKLLEDYVKAQGAK